MHSEMTMCVTLKMSPTVWKEGTVSCDAAKPTGVKVMTSSFRSCSRWMEEGSEKKTAPGQKRLSCTDRASGSLRATSVVNDRSCLFPPQHLVKLQRSNIRIPTRKCHPTQAMSSPWDRHEQEALPTASSIPPIIIIILLCFRCISTHKSFHLGHGLSDPVWPWQACSKTSNTNWDASQMPCRGGSLL